MSAVVTEITNPLLAERQVEIHPTRRHAFYLSSQGQPLFAWLHTSSTRTCLDHGVIVCPPISFEQLHAHRSLRHLADSVAQLGIPTLRFDWHGTGDSTGTDDDPNLAATWQTNLRDAITWMRLELGCQRISVIGLRLGATIAALNAADVENLILWAPVTNGRAYTREMKAIDLTSETRSRLAPAPSSDIEAGGFVLSESTAAAVSQWNLLKTQPASRRVLIVGRDDLPDDPRLGDWYLTAHSAVEQVAVPGYLEMMAEPHHVRVPESAIQQITAWLAARVPTQSLGEIFMSPQALGQHEAVMRHQPELAAPSTTGQQIRERPLQISDEPDLFGILCEPVIPVDENLPTIVLLNSGSAYRIGPSRLHVHITRKLAAQGFRCVRLDICGLGDSVTTDSAKENETYAATAFRDVDLTLKRLQEDFGVKQCVLMGLCSGAYAAFQSAASVPNPILVQSILINPLTFFWQDGMTLGAAPVRQLVAQHYYLSSALQPAKWIKLLSGRSRIGLGGALRLLVQRLGLSRRPKKFVGSDAGKSQPRQLCSHPQQDDLPADLEHVAVQGRKLAMFFATSDPGYSILLHKAKQQTNALVRKGMLQLSFIKDADHTFSRRAARSDLVESLSAYLLAIYQSAR